MVGRNGRGGPGIMVSQWVIDEVQDVTLFDKRLEQRFRNLLDNLSQASTASIPAACNDRAEMVAAYRFFDNEKVQFENVIAPHIESTYRRINNQKIVLLVQDTTELDLTRPHSEVAGAGPLHNGNRNGALLHLLHAFTTDGTPLGTVSAEAWTREPKSDEPAPKRGSSEKRVQIKNRPFHDNETYRWLTTAEHCTDVRSHVPQTQLVMLADRESDITEVIDFCRCQTGFDWIIRSDGGRILNKDVKSDPSIAVRESLRKTKALFDRELEIRQRHSWGSATVKHRPGKADRRERAVSVSVHGGTVTLNDPRTGKRDGVTVNAVLVRETKPTIQDEPIEWLLLTSLLIESREQVEQVIEYYLQRWMIELFSRCSRVVARLSHVALKLWTYSCPRWRCI